MTRLEIEGGSYAEALPSGEFAALVLGARVMRTHMGALPLPEGDYPLYHRITTAGGFQMAGQSWAGRGTWHWHDDRWYLDPRLSYGVSAAIFDQQGRLQVLEYAPHQTSQGYRYVAADGRLVTGDETYGPFHGLHEYTPLAPNLWVGQASDRLAAAILTLERGQFVRRQLDDGQSTFLRGTPHGPDVGLAMVKPDRSVLLWGTLHELRSRPVLDEEPTMPDFSDTDLDRRILATLTQVRAKYPNPIPDKLRETLGAILNETAWIRRHAGDPVWLEAKDDDNSALQPKTNRRLAKDIIQTVEHEIRYGRDFLDATGIGVAGPYLGRKGLAEDVKKVDPVDPGGIVVTPPPPAGDLSARVAALEVDVQTLKAWARGIAF